MAKWKKERSFTDCPNGVIMDFGLPVEVSSTEEDDATAVLTLFCPLFEFTRGR